MEAEGAGPDELREAFARAVTEHPACAYRDRLLLVTRERYSERVIATMLAWSEAETSALPHAAAAAGP
jgi:hypothetical protein